MSPEVWPRSLWPSDVVASLFFRAFLTYPTESRPPLHRWGIPPIHLHLSSGRCLPRAMNAEMLDVYDPYLGYDAETFLYKQPPMDDELHLSRLTKIVVSGITMMAGTLAVLYYGLHTGSEQRALTLAFTTFVLCQVFNVFNARNEKGTSFNAHVFDEHHAVGLTRRGRWASGHRRALAASAGDFRDWRHDPRRLGPRDGRGRVGPDPGRRAQARPCGASAPPPARGARGESVTGVSRRRCMPASRSTGHHSLPLRGSPCEP